MEEGGDETLLESIDTKIQESLNLYNKIFVETDEVSETVK
jgi:hypothetical protein